MTEKWWHQAACKGADVNIFYPAIGGTTTYTKALRLCAKCPVRIECLTEALDTDTEYGMRGGMTPRQRAVYAARRDGTLPPIEAHGDAIGTRRGYERELKAGVPPCEECKAGHNARQTINRNKRKAAMAQ